MEIEKLLQELPPEAAKFFAFFGRFECALKKVGCLKSAEKGARAEAGWDKFAKSLGERFYGEVQESGKANLFWENPPKKQIVGRGGAGRGRVGGCGGGGGRGCSRARGGGGFLSFWLTPRLLSPLLLCFGCF